jgi:Zn-finger nucleic acid-binding protein
MRPLQIDETQIDRCETCYGVWFDASERLKVVSNKKLADVIDIGDAAVGAEQDKITEADCPRCGTPMQHRKHPDQKHIGYERCDECGGSFFDAGELRDLSSLSIGDIFKSIFRVT